MTFRQRDNLAWCVCTGHVVFLDIEADRYFCLPNELEGPFKRLVSGEMEPADKERLYPLIARGLLIEDPDSDRLPPMQPIEPATGDFSLNQRQRPSLSQLGGALVSEMRAALLLWRRPFLAVIKSQSRLPRNGGPRDLDSCVRGIVSASAASALILRATNRCLVRAIAVHSACRSRGINSKLVFGVRMYPFGAHCWVQLNSKVLVGDFEQARLYTPILVVG